MGRVLSSLGHVVAYASDGNEVLPKAKQIMPDLVLLDIVMPGMDGFRAMRVLRNDPATAKIPVVLVSTKNQQSDVFWGKKQGADEHVGKPYTPEQMTTLIQRYVR